MFSYDTTKVRRAGFLPDGGVHSHRALIHPELNLQASTTVLTVWTTLIAGLIGAACHFLGWALLLIGSAGWASRGLPRVLSMLYLAAGAVALFLYKFPALEGTVLLLMMVIGIWQGILMWPARPGPAKPAGT